MPLPFDGAAHQQQRPAAVAARDRLTHRRLVVAIDLDRFPAERFGLWHQRVKRRMSVAHALETAESRCSP